MATAGALSFLWAMPAFAQQPPTGASSTAGEPPAQEALKTLEQTTAEQRQALDQLEQQLADRASLREQLSRLERLTEQQREAQERLRARLGDEDAAQEQIARMREQVEALSRQQAELERQLAAGQVEGVATLVETQEQQLATLQRLEQQLGQAPQTGESAIGTSGAAAGGAVTGGTGAAAGTTSPDTTTSRQGVSEPMGTSGAAAAGPSSSQPSMSGAREEPQAPQRAERRQAVLPDGPALGVGPESVRSGEQTPPSTQRPALGADIPTPQDDGAGQSGSGAGQTGSGAGGSTPQ